MDPPRVIAWNPRGRGTSFDLSGFISERVLFAVIRKIFTWIKASDGMKRKRKPGEKSPAIRSRGKIARGRNIWGWGEGMRRFHSENEENTIRG